MFNKKKKKKNKSIENEVVIDETIDTESEELPSEHPDFSFEFEKDIYDESDIIETDNKEDDSTEDIINFGGNGRKSFIEDDDLKFKEVINDIETKEELDSNFINLSEDNEIVVEETEVVEETVSESIEENNEEDTETEEGLIPKDENKEETDPKELKKYFDDSKKQNKKLAKKNPKKKRSKRDSKRSLKKKQVYDDIQNQKIFKFRGKKYSKVEDFIKFLNDNYLDIDKISQEVLDDKAFYGFIAKKSGVFDSSIKEFKSIKEEIGD